MKKTSKYLLIGSGLLIALPLSAMVILATTFDPNEYKPMLIRMMQEEQQRTLSIPGDIKLSFFPSIGVELGKVSLSEQSSSEEFASVDSARVAVALLPLLSKRVVIDHVELNGATVRLLRLKDGRTNIDSFMASDRGQTSDDTGAADIEFAISGIAIKNASIALEDRQLDRSLQLTKLDLETNKIANGVPSKVSLSADIASKAPQLTVHFDLSSGLQFDLRSKHFSLTGLKGEFRGASADLAELHARIAGNIELALQDNRVGLEALQIEASGKQGARAFKASLSAPQIAVSGDTIAVQALEGKAQLIEEKGILNAGFTASGYQGSSQSFRLPRVAIDLTAKQDQMELQAKMTGELQGKLDQLQFSSPQLQLVLNGRQANTPMSGTITTPLTLDLQAKKLEMSRLAAALSLPNPAGGALKLSAEGKIGADLGRQTAATTLAGTLDQSRYELRAGLSNFAVPAYHFDLSVDKIDLDRYRTQPTTVASGKNQAQAKPSSQPIDLAILGDLRAKGSIRVGSLKAENVRASEVQLGLHAVPGKLEVNPMGARLYGGSMSGALLLTASTPPRFSVTQELSGINIGPLLKDAFESNQLEGKGNVSIALQSQGATIDQLKKASSGNIAVSLRDGSVRGINLAQTLRNAKSRINSLKGSQGDQTGTGSDTETTDFTELNASFLVANGVLHNKDLAAKSPLFRISGAGAIDIPDERLDYLVRTAVVATLKGQGGAEMNDLKGLTVPVRLTGPLDAIKWRIDFKEMVAERTQQQIEEKKAAVQAQAKEKLSEQKTQMKDQFKDALKGLLSR